MKKALSLLLPFICIIGYSQSPLVPEWVIEKTPVIDQQGEAWSVTAGADGYLYWSTNQTMVDIYKDIVLYKLDTSGTEIWAQPGIYRSTQTEQAYVVTEKNGIVYTGGRICDCVNVNLICCDFLLVAFDTLNGDTLWSKRYDLHGEYEECDGLVVEDSVIYATGWTREAGTTWFDVLLMKTDLNGNIIWQQTYDEGTGNDERQDGHIVVDNNNIFMTGVVEGVASTFVPLSGLDGQAALWKYDKNGNYINHTTWGYNGAWIDADDALGMTTDGTDLIAVGYLSPSGNNTDWFVRKYDKNLNLIWQDNWGGINGEAGRAATVDPNGNIWAVVNTSSYGDSTLNIGLLKYSPSGQLQDFYLWGGNGDESAQDIIYHDGALYLSGSTTTTISGNPHAILIKVNIDSIVGVKEVENYAAFTVEKNYPNPAKDLTNFTIELAQQNLVTLIIYDLAGNVIATPLNKIVEKGKHTIPFDTGNLSEGYYIYSFNVNKHTHSRMFSVVK